MWKVLSVLLVLALAPALSFGGALVEESPRAIYDATGDNGACGSGLENATEGTNYYPSANADALTGVDVNIGSYLWPTSKLPPPLSPSNKTVLFVAHFFVSTDVNHMLLMAEELRSRGHNCHFIVMEPYVKRVIKAGFAATPTPDVLQGAGLETIQRAFSYASHETSWFIYIYKYICGLAPLAAEYHEPSLVIVKDWIKANGKPDLIVASKASESAIEVAWYNDIPFSVLFTMPLGGMINQYEDVPAAPDSNMWGSIKDQSQMWMRVRKPLVRILMIANPVSFMAGLKLAWGRYKHNFNPFSVPGDYWKKSIVISPWSMGIDLARPLRPLTHLVGFMTPKLPTLPHDEASLAQFSSEDQEHIRYLNSKKDGVVFCAFGSLAVLTQEWFDEMVAGLDLWARTQGTASGAVIAVNQLSLKAGLNVSAVPDTVQVAGWINQKLFLAHPHTKVFVTHGGLGSLGESIEARVPMLVFPLFFDQPNNAHRLEEAGVALKLHFREEKVTRSKIASRLNRLTTDPSFAENMVRQYQINRRAGGVSKAVDILEDALLLEGNMNHLIPVTERVSFFQRTNADLYLLAILCFSFAVKKYLLPIIRRYQTDSTGLKVTPNEHTESVTTTTN